MEGCAAFLIQIISAEEQCILAETETYISYQESNCYTVPVVHWYVMGSTAVLNSLLVCNVLIV